MFNFFFFFGFPSESENKGGWRLFWCVCLCLCLCLCLSVSVCPSNSPLLSRPLSSVGSFVFGSFGEQSKRKVKLENKEKLKILLCEPAQGCGILPNGALKQQPLLLLQLVNPALNRVLNNEAPHLHGPELAKPVDAVHCLRLCTRIPPRIRNVHSARSRQVQRKAASLFEGVTGGWSSLLCVCVCVCACVCVCVSVCSCQCEFV